MTTALRWAQNLSNVEAKIATLGAEQDEESASLVFDSYTDLTNWKKWIEWVWKNVGLI